MSEENVSEPVEQESGGPSKVLIAVGIVVAVLVLICCVIFALLTILGPQIGNVFHAHSRVRSIGKGRIVVTPAGRNAVDHCIGKL